MNKCLIKSSQAIALVVVGASLACLAVPMPSTRGVSSGLALDELLDIDDELQQRPNNNFQRADDNEDLDQLYQASPSRQQQVRRASSANDDDDQDEDDVESDGDLTSASDLSQSMMADEQQQQQPDHLHGMDTNIENAKLELSAQDMQSAAGHHHHHKHYVHGKMEMGAHTSKKGAFGWHAKFPVGGKGR